MNRSSLIAALGILATGCASVDYVGEIYPATAHVDLYFSESDVERPYRIMGEVLATGDQYISAARVQRRLMEEAQQKGADAVVILEVARVRGPEATQVQETVTEEHDEDSRTLKKTVSTSDLTAETKKIRALFIKYRD